jgi:hypothetical protein
VLVQGKDIVAATVTLGVSQLLVLACSWWRRGVTNWPWLSTAYGLFVSFAWACAASFLVWLVVSFACTLCLLAPDGHGFNCTVQTTHEIRGVVHGLPRWRTAMVP